MTDKIMDKIYAAYGTDSGILFGIKERDIVKTIVEFTLKNSKIHNLKKDNKILREALERFVNKIDNHPSSAAEYVYRDVLKAGKEALNNTKPTVSKVDLSSDKVQEFLSEQIKEK